MNHHNQKSRLLLPWFRFIYYHLNQIQPHFVTTLYHISIMISWTSSLYWQGSTDHLGPNWGGDIWWISHKKYFSLVHNWLAGMRLHVMIAVELVNYSLTAWFISSKCNTLSSLIHLASRLTQLTFSYSLIQSVRVILVMWCRWQLTQNWWRFVDVGDWISILERWLKTKWRKPSPISFNNTFRLQHPSPTSM